MEDKLKKLESVLKLVDQEYIKSQDVDKIVAMFTKVVTDLKTFLDKQISTTKNEVASSLKDSSDSLSQFEKNVQSILDGAKGTSLAKVQELSVTLSSEIKRIEGIIPKDSASDIGYLEDLIKTVEAKIPTIKDIEGKEIVSKINALDIEPELQIGIEHIRGLKEILDKKSTGNGVNAIINGGVMGRELFQDIDISSQLDGVTTTFNIQAVYRIISVDLSSFPYGALRKNIDYSYTPTTITFLSPIVASSQLSSGQTCIITAVSA